MEVKGGQGSRLAASFLAWVGGGTNSEAESVGGGPDQWVGQGALTSGSSFGASSTGDASDFQVRCQVSCWK